MVRLTIQSEDQRFNHRYKSSHNLLTISIDTFAFSGKYWLSALITPLDFPQTHPAIACCDKIENKLLF